MSCLISIVIPAYNRSTSLKEALQSVLQQTYQNYELIIVDDGSTDDTREMLEREFCDERIKIISVPHNKGVSWARNQGIEASHGDWISFLDSDDLWLPQKLEKQVSYLTVNPEVRLCQTEEIWIRDGKRVNPHKKHQKHSGWIFEKCLPLCIVSPSAVMIHKEVFGICGLFDENLPACEDYDLWLRISLHYPIITLSAPLIIKRGGHKDQLSRKYWGMDRFRIQALQKILLNPCLNESQRKLVEENIQYRQEILEKGAKKRRFPHLYH